MDPIPVRLSADIQDRVDRLADKLSVSRSAILRMAIGHWLDAAELQQLNPLLREQDGAASAAASAKRRKVSYPAKKAAKKAAKPAKKATQAKRKG